MKLIESHSLGTNKSDLKYTHIEASEAKNGHPRALLHTIM